MKRSLEAFKNVVIVVLSCSLVFLSILAVPGGMTATQNAIRSLLETVGLQPTDALPTANYGMAATPILISYRNEGGRVSLYGDDTALEQEFTALTPLLSTAFSTAKFPAVRTQTEFFSALSASGIYLSFQGEIPVNALALWLGASQAPADDSAEGCLLSCVGDRVELWLFGEDVTAFATDVKADAVNEVVGSIPPDGSAFACEKEGSLLNGKTFLPAGTVSLVGGQITNPCTLTVAQSMASALEFNPYGSGAYVDYSGAFVFSESGRTFTLTADGTAMLTADEGQYGAFAADTADEVGYITAAQQLLQTLCADRLGSARVSLSAFEKTKEGGICTFGYLYEGTPIVPMEATVTFAGTQITAFSVPVRTVSPTANEVLPLPITQAAAIVQEGAELELVYRTGEDGVLSAEWRVV